MLGGITTCDHVLTLFNNLIFIDIEFIKEMLVYITMLLNFFIFSQVITNSVIFSIARRLTPILMQSEEKLLNPC